MVAVLFVLIVGLGGTFASAETQDHSNWISSTKTNWEDTLVFPLFDPALGTLNCIQFCLTGKVDGSSRFENLDSEPAKVTMDLYSVITLYRPDMTQIVVAIPLISTSDNVSAYDGITDYLGTSGRTYDLLSASKQVCVTSPPPVGDLALFTGVGNIILPVSAAGYSSGSGAGNLQLEFSTVAAADVRVRYCYDPIPEPSAAVLFVLGLTPVVGALRLRRR